MSAAETPKRGGTLRLAVGADPRSIDAAQVFSDNEAMLAFFLFNTLIDPAPNGGFLPVPAESLPTTSPDGFTHRFRLRQGVRFSSGQELTSDVPRGAPSARRSGRARERGPKHSGHDD